MPHTAASIRSATISKPIKVFLSFFFIFPPAFLLSQGRERQIFDNREHRELGAVRAVVEQHKADAVALLERDPGVCQVGIEILVHLGICGCSLQRDVAVGRIYALAVLIDRKRGALIRFIVFEKIERGPDEAITFCGIGNGCIADRGSGQIDPGVCDPNTGSILPQGANIGIPIVICLLREHLIFGAVVSTDLPWRIHKHFAVDHGGLVECERAAAGRLADRGAAIGAAEGIDLIAVAIEVGAYVLVVLMLTGARICSG